jgi:hypothetical protein
MAFIVGAVLIYFFTKEVFRETKKELPKGKQYLIIEK